MLVAQLETISIYTTIHPPVQVHKHQLNHYTTAIHTLCAVWYVLGCNALHPSRCNWRGVWDSYYWGSCMFNCGLLDRYRGGWLVILQIHTSLRLLVPVGLIFWWCACGGYLVWISPPVQLKSRWKQNPPPKLYYFTRFLGHWPALCQSSARTITDSWPNWTKLAKHYSFQFFCFLLKFSRWSCTPAHR